MVKIRCRCGATEIEISAEPIVQFYCHCDDCHTVHGGAYAPESVYPADTVNVVGGDPTNWKLKRNPGFTCRECGTRLCIDVQGLNLRGVNGFFLLPPCKFQPAFHMHCGFAVRPVIDDLPHYKGLPKRFGGSDAAAASLKFQDS